jgi:hypothetical protein
MGFSDCAPQTSATAQTAVRTLANCRMLPPRVDEL